MAKRKYKQPEAWMVEGAKAYFEDKTTAVPRQVTLRSAPWQLGHGEWVVLIEGKSGGYGISFLRPNDEANPAHRLGCGGEGCAAGCDVAAAERRLDEVAAGLR